MEDVSTELVSFVTYNHFQESAEARNIQPDTLSYDETRLPKRVVLDFHFYCQRLILEPTLHFVHRHFLT